MRKIGVVNGTKVASFDAKYAPNSNIFQDCLALYGTNDVGYGRITIDTSGGVTVAALTKNAALTTSAVILNWQR